MIKWGTTKLFAWIISTYAILSLIVFTFKEILNFYVVTIILGFPYYTVYIFHRIGVPGMLEHNGYCGWGLCSPTTFGWVLSICFWVFVAWLIAWGSVRLTRHSR